MCQAFANHKSHLGLIRESEQNPIWWGNQRAGTMQTIQVVVCGWTKTKQCLRSLHDRAYYRIIYISKTNTTNLFQQHEVLESHIDVMHVTVEP